MERTGSFIPSQAKRSTAPARRTRRIYIFTYISYVLFFGTLLAVVGIFLYETQLNRSLEEQKQLLLQERESFNQSDLIRVRDMETRIQTAERILNNHAAVSEVFTILESNTVETVQLSGFSISRELGNEYTMNVVGGTETFDSLIFQDEVLAALESEVGYEVTDVSFGVSEGVDEESAGGDSVESIELPVGFSISFTVPTEAIAYTGLGSVPAVLPPVTTEVAGDEAAGESETTVDAGEADTITTVSDEEVVADDGEVESVEVTDEIIQ